MDLEETTALNPEQKQSVEYTRGPLLIIAGAGTGKTRIIVEKIKYLIKQNLAKPEQILALTFTEKAASEMEERVDKAIPYGYFQMWISTFHSFADQILKEHAAHIGLPPDFRIITDAEVILFLRKNLFLFRLDYFRPLGNPTKFLEAFVQHFARLRDENISPYDYLLWAKNVSKKELDNEEKAKYLELAHTYKKYQELKIKENLADFSDLVFYLIELFKKRESVLDLYRRTFKYVLVDEFQDTNIAQYQLLKLLCPPLKQPQLTVVGDDSQAIYKFRGASVSNILTFIHDYPKAKQITLRNNYRSNQSILDSAYRLIKHNDPAMDIFRIDIKDISLLLAFSKKISRSLFDAIEIYTSFFGDKQQEFTNYEKYLPLVKEESRKKLQDILHMIKRHLGLLRKETAGQILYFFLEDTKYLNSLVSYKTEKDEKIALNISKFFNKLKSFETTHEDASVTSVVEYIDMSMRLGESPLATETDIASYNAVNMLTVHSAKGLEFPIVFLVNLSRGRFPTYSKKEAIPIPQALIKEILPEGDYHLEEERRLFYVGMTRAMDKVFTSASVLYGEGKRERKLSPFVIEALGVDFIKKHLVVRKDEKQQLTIFDFKKVEEKISKEKMPITHFSYSQIESYKLCPLQYKYRYVLKIPTTPSSATSFGESIHKVLQKFYQEFLSNTSISKERLIQILREVWVPVGYDTEVHEAKMKKEAEKMLLTFFEKYHNPAIKIVALEKLFKIKVDNSTFITGKIDRVDVNGNNGIEIIDYKTGQKPDKDKLQQSLQLSIYALAATDKGLYNKKLDEVTLTFYYLQKLEKFSMKRTAKDMEKMHEKIKSTVKNIRQNEFLPNVGPWCDFCAFRMICEAWQ
ncbi:ATP-dependent helicase [Candidatus Roizmanbacteria bacterium]|nr:ATP-dependent helicase [Candidatus Roizmanbacteria bacterium]